MKALLTPEQFEKWQKMPQWACADAEWVRLRVAQTPGARMHPRLRRRIRRKNNLWGDIH